MKIVDLEIKRMLGLLESKMGNVKPLISEQIDLTEDDGEISFKTPEEWLTWLSGPAGCLTNKNAESISKIGNIKPENIQKLRDSGVNNVNAGDPYVSFMMNKLRFFVFAKRNSKGAFLLVKFDDGLPAGKKYSENQLICPELKRKESFVSDVKNLSLEQKQRLNDLVSQFGVKETGAELTTTRPTGKEGYDFVPVDLSTGKGTNGIQYIQKTAVDGLEPEFKTAGQYYVWAKIGKSVERTSVVGAVEDALSKMGYTRTEPTDALAMNAQPTTLGEYCKSNPDLCANYPLLGEYIQKYGGDLKIWETDPESYKKFGASAIGGRKSAREIKNVMQLEANKTSCQTAINVLWNCMRSNDDKSCEKYIKASFGSEVPYIKARQELQNLIIKCERNSVDVSGIGGKKYDTYWNELKTSTNKFSPYSKENLKSKETGPQYKSLEESLSKNIRLSLKEMKTKRMR